MPSPLPPEIRRRLGLVLAMLTSPHDGEALAAARMACKLLDRHGWRPEDLAAAPAGAQQQPPRDPPREHRPPPPPPEPEPEVAEVLEAGVFADWLLHFAVGLTDRETAFLADLSAKGWGRASDKQAAWLRSIARKVPSGRRSA